MKNVVISAAGSVTCPNKHTQHCQLWPPSVICALEKVFLWEHNTRQNEYRVCPMPINEVAWQSP